MAQYDLDTLGKIESNVSSLALELRLYFHDPETYDDLGSIASCADRICELASPAHAALRKQRDELAAALRACDAAIDAICEEWTNDELLFDSIPIIITAHEQAHAALERLEGE